METLPITKSKQTSAPPQQALQHFCTAYSHCEAQQMLWKWFILALKADYDGLNSARTTQLISFYENIKALISAVYQLHDLPPEKGQAPLTTTSQQTSRESGCKEVSIATALDVLHNKMHHNWTLLICPPE
ncbi:hypothetical protein ACSX1A_11030 [Pontibacter sp. MBLB2868]|uniref:hypothetical protein n=1 Tax=Pontibacter sp. MBLB2868 TaxID=3451555 RepID=UPI003F74FE3F